MDGLRAVAIVLVFFSHAHVPMFDGAFFGVDIFFVLSGFLITSLLLMEHGQSGRIDCWRFYRRRFFRLMPALLLFLAIYWLVAPRIWPDNGSVTQDVLVSALYLADYGIAFFDSPDALLHMWSLSVEEHFYLVWPLLLGLLLRRLPAARVWGTVALLYVLGFVWRMYWVQSGQLFYEVFFRFDTRATGLLLGSLLATVAVQRPQWFAALVARQRYLLWLVLAFPFAVAGFAWDENGALLWGLALAELAAAAAIIAIHNRQGVVFDMLSIPALVWLGRISYGVYLWHYPVVRVLRSEFSWPWVVALGLPLSIGLAALSFYTVERLALRWRDGTRRPAGRAAPAAARAPAKPPKLVHAANAA